MHLNRIHLQNVRQFESKTFYFRPGFNLLVGANGAGKSTLLLSIRAALGKQQGRTPMLTDDDIRLRARELLIHAGVEGPAPNHLIFSKFEKRLGKRAKRETLSSSYDPRIPPLLLYFSSTEASCNSFAFRKSRKYYPSGTTGTAEKEEWLYHAERRSAFNPNVTERFGSSRSVREFVIKVLSTFSDTFIDFAWSFEPYDCRIRHPDANLPPSVGRALISSILRYFQEEQGSQLRSIDQSSIIINSEGYILGEEKTHSFIPPFREMLRSVETDSETASKLKDCRIEVMLTPRIRIRSSNGTFFLNQLSDGEQRLFSLFVDIARQLYVQSMERDIDTNFAIVLIDEIDVHLHPKWQRLIVEALKDLFPDCQFIASTHSPFVVQTARDGEVIKLDGDLALEPAGRTIEEVARFVMGVKDLKRSPRFTKMIKVAQSYLDLSERAKLVSRLEREEIRKELVRLLAPFSDNPAYIALLERRGMIDPENREENGGLYATS